jgi:peptidyl-prolyl cis-trans isomerase D
MLQKIRDNTQSVTSYIILGLMVIAMAAFGIGPLIDSIGGQPAAVVVNGEEISENQVLRDVERRRLQLYQSGQSDIDSIALREEVIDRLILSTLLRQATEDLDLAVSRAQVDRMIIENPAFAGIDGYDPNVFQQRVVQAGYSTTEFIELLANDYLVQQYLSGGAQSTFVSEQEIAAFFAIAEQKRKFEYGILAAGDGAELEVSQEALQAAYDAQRDRFTTTSSMTAKYVQVTRDDLLDGVSVSEDQLRAEFELLQSAEAEQSSKLVAHILIADQGDGTQAERVAEVQAKLDEGQSFDLIAEEFSDDFLSAELGGELGETDGTVFDPAIEDAVAELAVGEVSGPVETDFGIHFVKVLDSSAGESLVFEDLRDELEERVIALEIERLYAIKIAELRDAAFQFGDIESLAESLGLQVMLSSEFTLAEGEGILEDAAVRATAFSSEVLEDRLLSDVVETEDGVAVVIAVDQFSPSRLLALEEVESQLIAEERAKLASQLALERGGAMVELASSGSNLSSLLEEVDAEWLVTDLVGRGDIGVPALVLDAAFKAPVARDGTRTFSATTLPSGDVLVLGMINVQDGSYEADDESAQMFVQQFYGSMYANSEFQAFVEELKRNAEIEIR